MNIYKIFWPRIDFVICITLHRPDQWKRYPSFFLCNCWSYSGWLFWAPLRHLCANLLIIPP